MTGMSSTMSSSEIDDEIDKLRQQEQEALKTINNQHELIFKLKERMKILQKSKLFCINGNGNGNGHIMTTYTNGGMKNAVN